MSRKPSAVLLGLFLAPVAGLAAQQPTVNPATVFAVPQVPASVALKPDPKTKRVWFDEGARTWAPRPTVAAIAANDLRTRLYQLSDDSMMGRQVGTLGNVKGTAFIAAEFKKAGLEPGGDNGTFFQLVKLGPHWIDSTAITLTVGGAPLQWRSEWTPLAPSSSFGPAFKGTNVPVIFGGRWGDTTVAFDSVATHGKILVFVTGNAARAGGSGGYVIDSRITFDSAAAGRGGAGGGRGGAGGRGGGGGGRGGAGGAGGGGLGADLRPRSVDAAAILVVNLEGMDQAALATPFTSNTRNSMRSAIPGAGASISEAAFQKIFGKPASQLKVGDAGAPISGAWDYAYHTPEFVARNVIAIRRGSDPVLKNEYVVIGAHNDHVGMVRPGASGAFPEHDSLRAFKRVLQPQGANDRVALDAITTEQWKQINDMIKVARTIRPARPDSVNNGADDDGSGTAVLMEIAEAFAKGVAPKRSVIFVSHTGEESGMYGSTTFTDFPTIPRDKIVAAFNMDMLGKGRVTDVNLGGPNSVQILGSRRLSTGFGDVIDSVNATRTEPMAIDYTWEMTRRLNRFCRSDQTSYFRFNIPVAYFSLGYAIDYHSPTDEPQYIDYDHGAKLGRFIHDVVAAIANRNSGFVNDGPKQNRFQGCSGG